MGGPPEVPKISMAGQLVYEIQCLLFSLNSVPRVFTKLLKPILAMLWHQGMRLVMYLDDVSVMSQNRED